MFSLGKRSYMQRWGVDTTWSCKQPHCVYNTTQSSRLRASGSPLLRYIIVKLSTTVFIQHTSLLTPQSTISVTLLFFCTQDIIQQTSSPLHQQIMTRLRLIMAASRGIAVLALMADAPLPGTRSSTSVQVHVQL